MSATWLLVTTGFFIVNSHLNPKPETRSLKTPHISTITPTNQHYYNYSNWREVFENLNAVWPSREAIRVASLDRHLDYFTSLKSDPNNDRFVFSPETLLSYGLVTNNPTPILMLKNKAALFQLHYQLTTPVEKNIRWIFRQILGDTRSGCNAYEHDGLVLDVGANEGFYTLLSSAYGCRTVAFEPQILCVAWLDYSITLNRFKHPPKLLNKIVSHIPLEMDVNSAICSGMNFYSQETKFELQGTAEKKSKISSVSLDEVIEANKDQVLLLHIDTEGAEIQVLMSAMNALKGNKIKNIIFEVFPKWWDRFNLAYKTGISFLKEIQNIGYVCRIIDRYKFDIFPLHSIAPVALDETTIKHDNGYDIWCTLTPEYFSVVQNKLLTPNSQSNPGFMPKDLRDVAT